MADCVDYDCTELDNHLQNDCGEIFLGGVPEAIILLCGNTVTDPSNATQINTNIASGKAKLITGVKIGIPKASAINIPSPVGGQPDKIVNYNRTATLIDANDNSTTEDFYNVLLAGKTIAGLITREPDADKVRYYNAIMSFTGSRVIPDNDGDYVRWEVDIAWKSKTDAITYSTPTGIFSY